jgi:hypothetical protein
MRERRFAYTRIPLLNCMGAMLLLVLGLPATALSEPLIDGVVWKELSGTGPAYSFSCTYYLAERSPNGDIEYHVREPEEREYKFLMKAFGSLDGNPAFTHIHSVGEIYLLLGDQRAYNFSNRSAWSFDPLTTMFETQTKSPKGDILGIYVDVENREGGVGVYEAENVLELATAELGVIGIMRNCESAKVADAPRFVAVQESDKGSFEELSRDYGDNAYEARTERLNNLTDRLEEQTRSRIETFTSACMTAFPSKGLCECLASKRPWHIDFGEYLEIVSNEEEFLQREEAGLEQPIEGFKATLAARDTCINN